MRQLQPHSCIFISLTKRGGCALYDLAHLNRFLGEPELARMCIVEVLAAGPRAIARRNAAIESVMAGRIIVSAGRIPRQRTTLYGDAEAGRSDTDSMRRGGRLRGGTRFSARRATNGSRG